MLNLFVGDIYEELSAAAKKVDSNAYLVDKTNYQQASGVCYTSLADMQSHELFNELCKQASKINYNPPKVWSDTDKKGHSVQQYYTELILHYYAQFKPVENLPETKRSFLARSYLKDTRRVETPQIWIAGGSDTTAVGVDTADTWKENVSAKLDLPYSDLSEDGSSITWASDQLLLNDIRKDDVVFWNLTVESRFAFFKDGDIVHAQAHQYKRFQDFVTIDYFSSDNMYYQSVQAVRKVANFCNKIGAKLVICNTTIYDWDSTYVSYNVPCFRNIFVWPEKFLDYGTDNQHPGPKTHKWIAEEFLNFYNLLYSKS